MKIENTPTISRDIFKTFVNFFKKETTEIMDIAIKFLAERMPRKGMKNNGVQIVQ